MKISYKDNNKENWFLISWTLSNKCNYSCSYCPSRLHNGSTGHKDWNIVKDFVMNFKKPSKEICYRISGGEPTTWKYFIDLAELIKKQGHIFSFLSNGSRNIDYFKKISEYTDGLILSYHPEYTDINHFIEIIKVMNCPVAINLMLLPNKFDDLVSIADKIYNSSDNVLIWPKVILNKDEIDGYPTNEVIEYSKYQLNFIKNWPYYRSLNDNKLHRGSILLNNTEVDANYLIMNKLNRHNGWHCYAGIDMINIDMNGNMYRADCAYGGPVGNLENYDLPENPVVSGMKSCNCLSDIYLRKELL